jgi:hypothetical protein
MVHDVGEADSRGDAERAAKRGVERRLADAIARAGREHGARTIAVGVEIVAIGIVADFVPHRSIEQPRLLEAVGTNIFAYHGYTEVFLGGRWLKVSPTFNASLCAKLGVAPLFFDGRHDALLQSFDGQGREFMAYIADHGAFFDVPVKFLIIEMTRLYPKLCIPGGLRGASMEQEAKV